MTLGLMGLATIAIIFYGRGYRFDGKDKTMAGTGSLVVTSDPNGARVIVDGKFMTATNSTIQLPEGEYTIQINKEGYIPWERRLPVKTEVVTQASATLFPTNPSLSPLTSSGIINPVVSPDGSKIAFVRSKTSSPSGELTDTPSPEGIWVVDLIQRPIALSRDPRQIVRTTPALNWENARLIWSPDGKDILALFETNPAQKPSLTTSNTIQHAFLLQSDQLNTIPSDVTGTIDLVLSNWELEQSQLTNEKLVSLPKELTPIASSSMELIAFSPDDTKLLYEAKASGTLPTVINPPLFGTNPTREARTIAPGNFYVYDSKEDKNYLVISQNVSSPSPSPKPALPQRDTIASPSGQVSVIQTRQEKLDRFSKQFPLEWYASSRHLAYIDGNHITMMEYDGTNKTVIYGGPFSPNFLAAWPGGGKVVILTTLNAAALNQPNLYLVNLR